MHIPTVRPKSHSTASSINTQPHHRTIHQASPRPYLRHSPLMQLLAQHLLIYTKNGNLRLPLLRHLEESHPSLLRILVTRASPQHCLVLRMIQACHLLHHRICPPPRLMEASTKPSTLPTHLRSTTINPRLPSIHPASRHPRDPRPLHMVVSSREQTPLGAILEHGHCLVPLSPSLNRTISLEGMVLSTMIITMNGKRRRTCSARWKML